MLFWRLTTKDENAFPLICLFIDFKIFELPLELAVPARPLNPGIPNDALGTTVS